MRRESYIPVCRYLTMWVSTLLKAHMPGCLRDCRDEGSVAREISSGRKNIRALNKRWLIIIYWVSVIRLMKLWVTVPWPQLQDNDQKYSIQSSNDITHLFTKWTVWCSAWALTAVRRAAVTMKDNMLKSMSRCGESQGPAPHRLWVPPYLYVHRKDTM